MPKILVIYYSLGGTTERVAESVAEATNADLLALRPRKEIGAQGFPKYPVGGFQVLTKKKPALQPLEKDPRGYDLLFIGTPVWANCYAPAVRTFFSQIYLEDKAVALFCTCRATVGRTFREMRTKLAGNRILGERTFVRPVDEEEPPPAAWAREMLARYEEST